MQSITVIVISWNPGELLKSCLQAIKQNGLRLISEIIIIDNASIDDSIEIVKKEVGDIKIIQNKKNVGFAKAANQAIDKSLAEYLLFVNTDAFLLPGCIEKLYNFIISDEKISIVAPRLYRQNGSIQKSATYYPTFFTEFFKPFFNLYLCVKERFYKLQKGYSVNTIRGACFLARKCAINEMGRFDERFFFFLEETDLCYRLKKTDWKIIYLPSAGVIHWGGASVKKAEFNRRKQYYTSILKFCQKHYSIFHSKLLEKFFVLTGKI